jgi:drug/metabolite transporter (DMT)-like permease
MALPLAYLMVILIWSTTPLAIKWSAAGVGFAFALVLRLLIAAAVTVILSAALQNSLPLHQRARRSYVAGGLGLFGAMYCVYWSAQYLDSGLVSVLFGMAPLISSLFAAAFLDDAPLHRHQLLGLCLSVIGLAMIFGIGTHRPDVMMLQGAAVLLLGVTLYSGSLVWMKQIGDDSPSLATTTGTTWVALPLFVLAWWFDGRTIPTSLDTRAGVAIAYLGVFGSVLGMGFYYYVVKHMTVSSVALVTLVTPVLGLLLGHAFNGEAVSLRVWTGALLIAMGLATHQARALAALWPMRLRAALK